MTVGLVAALGVGTAGVGLNQDQAAAVSAADPGINGKSWRVTPVPGGYRVTVELDQPAPLRSSMPVLAADGVPIGIARESQNRRTLTLVTEDPSVTTAREIRLAKPEEVRSNGQEPRAEAAAGPTDAYWLKPRNSKLLAADPGVAGKYKVSVSEYNLGDEAVYLPGLKQKSEVVGRVYTPQDAVGPRPVVLFLHGRHQVCYGSDAPSDKPWPCGPKQKPIPSYRGYDAPAKALASNGYQVVSISANAINGWDSNAYDAGAQARGELVLHHLALWKRWSTTGGGPFGRQYIGKLNLRNVGLMGHSRGGEGVARAAVLNSNRGGQYGIRAVLPLAPTDFARATVPGVAMSVLLPYCDGDVSDLQGQKFYDDTRYSVSRDNAPRSTVTVLGTNHNFFNTEWTPGQSVAPSDDDWYSEKPTDLCGSKHPGRLTAKEQQAVGAAYVAGFFRLYLGREAKFLPMFDGSDTRVASAGKAVVRVVAQAPLTSRREVNRLDQKPRAVTGQATAQVCAGVSEDPKTNPCVLSGNPGPSPHWVPAWFAARTPTTAVTKLKWTGTDGVVRFDLGAGQRDVRKFSALTFRAAPDPAAAPKTDLSVRVVDGRGRAAAVPVSTVSDALVRLPGTNDNGLAKNLLRTVHVPLATLKGVDLRNLRAIELRTDQVATGSAFLSDLAFAGAGLGTSAPERSLPRLAVSNAEVKEGNSGTRRLDFWVTLSRPSVRPVTAYAETSFDAWETVVVGDLHTKVTFRPGQVRQKLSVPVKPNTVDNDDETFSLVLSAPHDAGLGTPFGRGKVIDDDATPAMTVGTAVTVAENQKYADFPVKLSAPSGKEVWINGLLKDGTAKLRADYKSEQDDGGNPPPRYVEGIVERGKTTGMIRVLIVDDKVQEKTETFTAVLDDVRGGTIKLPVTLTGTITDND